MFQHLHWLRCQDLWSLYPYPSTFQTPPYSFPTTGIPPLNLVKCLMLDNFNYWNISLLLLLFSIDVVKEIRKIPISPVFTAPSLFWSSSKTETFSTKSAYLIDNNVGIHSASSLSSFPWKMLSSANLHDRHKLFLWKLVNNLLPTRAKISSLMNIASTSCPFCDMDVEIIDYLFINCVFISRIRFISKWAYLLLLFLTPLYRNWISYRIKMKIYSPMILSDKNFSFIWLISFIRFAQIEISLLMVAIVFPSRVLRNSLMPQLKPNRELNL